nr:3-hydroxyacyl-CoA dehydrogenase NAD-binding domain-containing protein [Alcanivorax sp.]
MPSFIGTGKNSRFARTANEALRFLVIEAVFENMDVKKGRVQRTGRGDVNRIAAFTNRPEDVMGMHFFSPANVMKLLENRGERPPTR